MVGRLSHGPESTLIERTLEFVWNELPRWRDDPERPDDDAEEALNSDLCKHLNARSRQAFPMVFFHHEERQTQRRRVDMSALPSEGQFVGEMYHSFRDPFIVFEGKRLPAPDAAREREYVTGGQELSGGIQRFKLSLHGAKHDLVAMIAYIQSREPFEWLDQINKWIRDLDGVVAQTGETWTANEQIVGFVQDAFQKLAQGASTHSRIGNAVSNRVSTRHLWVQMK